MVVVVVLVLAVQGVAAATAVRAAAELPIGAALAAAVAIGLAVALLRRPVTGPDIHDRQLDLILVAGGAVAVAALTVVQLTGSTDALGLLAAAPAAVAALAATVGTRRLWQLRAVPLVLAAGWPGPWDGLGPLVPVAVVLAVTTLVLFRGAARRMARTRAAARPGRHARSTSISATFATAIGATAATAISTAPTTVPIAAGHAPRVVAAPVAA